MKIFTLTLRFKLSLLYPKLCLYFLSLLPLPSLPSPCPLPPPPYSTPSQGSGFVELLLYNILINN